MKVLVTGGTGFVGHAVVAELRRASHEPSLLVRRPDSQRAQILSTRYGARLTLGDALDPDSLRRAMSGSEAVIHLVGIISEIGRNTFENAHIRATENVVRAATEARVLRYVHMSALGTRANARSRYHQTKWVAEQIVGTSSLAWTIFRPSLIYGPEDHLVSLLADVLRWSPFAPVLGNGRALLQPIPVEAVAAACVRALTEPRSIGQIYDLCGPDRLTFPELLDVIFQAAGHRRWKVRVPLGIARMQAAGLEFVFPRLLRRAAPLTRDQLLMLEEDNVGDWQTATELFDLPAPGIRDGIARCLRER